MVPRYVLFHRMPSSHSEDIERIRNTPGVSVIDETRGRALLIEATDEAVGELRSMLVGWLISSETHQLPPQPHRETVDPGR